MFKESIPALKEKENPAFQMQLLNNCCSIVHVHHLSRDFVEFKRKYVAYKDFSGRDPLAPWTRDWSRNVMWIDNHYSGNGQWLEEQLKPYGTIIHIEGVSCNPHGKKPAHVFLFTFPKEKDQNWLAETFRAELAKNPPKEKDASSLWK